jgi:protein-S-isoprenylcysteine O-methyltransferase Ste14
MSEKENVFTIRIIFLVVLFVVLFPMLPLIIPWKWNWWEAWYYALINIFAFVISRYLASRKTPDILRERSKFMQHRNTEPFDNILAPLLGVFGGLLPITVGLDARFGHSTAFPLWVHLLAALILLVSMLLDCWAFITNSFFSGTVRIQKDRGQHVIQSGPYRLMRHPGYSGALIGYLATPFLLDSLWAFIPMALLIIILVVRTSLEDRTLQEKLPGYAAYAQKTRYRLIPGIW